MAVDIVGYLEGQGLDLKYSGENVGSNDVAMQCPWCDDPSYHLTIHRSKGFLNCWRCSFEDYKLKNRKGWAPNFKALIKEIEQCSWKEAKARWEEIGGEGAQDSPVAIEGLAEFCSLPDEARLFSNPGPYTGIRDFAYNYLKNRGFTRYHIEKYNIHFCPEGYYGDRIIIPIYKNNKLVNWLGRRYNPNIKFRYRNCNIKKCVVRLNEMLYGEEEWCGNVLRIVEGALDRIRLEETAVGINRSKISFIQKRIICRLGAKADYSSLILDPEAYANAYEIAEELSALLTRLKIVRLPKGTDPAALTVEQITDIERKTPFIEF